MKTFKVYTFLHPRPGKPLRKGDISAYTMWANEAWKGCKVYEIEAESGAMAKVIACQRRFDELRADAAAKEGA